MVLGHEGAQTMSESISREVGRIFIPAPVQDDLRAENRTYRTCAYCRVSTDSDEEHLHPAIPMSQTDITPVWDMGMESGL